jgi:hypothetical protein
VKVIDISYCTHWEVYVFGIRLCNVSSFNSRRKLSFTRAYQQI